MKELTSWVSLVQWIAMLGITLWTWAVDRRAAQKRETDKIFADLRERVTIVEQRIAAVPDHHDLEKIYERMEAVNNQLHTLVGEFQGVHRTLQLLHEHLLTRKE